MLFNSLEFLLFFPVVTSLYFLFPHAHRWWLLLAASCLFYMAFIPVYILILFLTILIDYTAAIYIERSTGPRRKAWLVASILSTCAVLFVFKYFGFFNANFAAIARFFHWNYPTKVLEIILPIGLSFHTFQSLSYVVEVYRGNQKAERHFGIYSLYVMFYPQLVAGPIERPQNLLHQFREKHTIEYQRITDGLKLMAWGMFKKVVIADRLAVYVSQVYDHPLDYPQGISFIIATVFFAYQIYCDFSGYSDIAIGSAQVMGFRLMTNFNRPYYAKSIAEFWKRWHISLSTWFKDYLYIPMGGNRVARPRWYFNLFVTFLVSGLWHGANWTYVIWGALHGTYLILGIATQPIRRAFTKAIGLDRFVQVHRALQVAITFSLVCFGWIFFRARNLSDALYIARRVLTGIPDFILSVAPHLKSLNSGQNLLAPILLGQGKAQFAGAVLAIALLEGVHWLQRKSGVRALLAEKTAWLRWTVYVFISYGILCFGAFNDAAQFIYFQF